MSDDIKIDLTWAEILIAAQVGSMRNVQSLKNRCEPGNNAGDDDNWTKNIEGACGEMVFAKYRNVYWSGALGDYKADDVSWYNVKTNTSRKWDDLILRKGYDKPEKTYVLVLSFLPTFIICGFAHGVEAMRDEFWDERKKGRPAYFYPRKLLHSVETLPPF